MEQCTDGTPDENGEKAPWRQRKEAYLAHLPTVSEDALLVSACDKLHNVRAIVDDLRAGQDDFPCFKGGRDGMLWYCGALVDVFEERQSSVAARFRVAVEELRLAAPSGLLPSAKSLTRRPSRKRLLAI